jgi:hypothetical protein
MLSNNCGSSFCFADKANAMCEAVEADHKILDAAYHVRKHQLECKLEEELDGLMGMLGVLEDVNKFYQQPSMVASHMLLPQLPLQGELHRSGKGIVDQRMGFKRGRANYDYVDNLYMEFVGTLMADVEKLSATKKEHDKKKSVRFSGNCSVV